jgi:hypothetical protein
MKTRADSATHGSTAITRAFWLLLAIYAVARVFQAFPGREPMLAVVALHVIPPAASLRFLVGAVGGPRGECRLVMLDVTRNLLYL